MCVVGVILSIKQYKYTDINLNPKTVNSFHNPQQVSEVVGRGQIDMRSLQEGPLVSDFKAIIINLLLYDMCYSRIILYSVTWVSSTSDT